MAAALVFATAMATAILDQWTKRAARARGGASHNQRGAIIGISVKAAMAIFLALAVLLAVLLLRADAIPRPATIGLGLAAGGAASNLLDRIRLGAVIDFIRIGRWPAFNLADAALTVSIPLCAWSALR